MSHKQKSPSPTGLQLQNYLESIFNTLKSLAFHELYMQNQREELCKTDLYDPLTAFKAIDLFKHGKIVACELRSFLAKEGNGGYRVQEGECWEALGALNKRLMAVEVEDFQEMTLPANLELRNVATSRFNQLEVKVGTMTQVYDIKSTSEKKIAKFFMKEIEFYRELLLRKQDFCQKYGGDLYTLSQLLCKGKSNKFNFAQFSTFARSYKFYFNPQQFIALYKRTKSIPQPSPLFYDNIEDIYIEIQSLSHCLLAPAAQLDVKEKIRIVCGQPFDHLKEPSYKAGSIRLREENWKIEKELKENQKYISDQREKQSLDRRDIRYKFCFPEQQVYPYRHRLELKQMDRKWSQQVFNMPENQIDIRYRMIDRRHYFL